MREYRATRVSRRNARNQKAVALGATLCWLCSRVLFFRRKHLGPSEEALSIPRARGRAQPQRSTAVELLFSCGFAHLCIASSASSKDLRTARSSSMAVRNWSLSRADCASRRESSALSLRMSCSDNGTPPPSGAIAPGSCEQRHGRPAGGLQNAGLTAVVSVRTVSSARST